MKIFVSWSGSRSKAVAELFSDWLKCVIQVSQPWISTRDIDRGAIWFSEINDKLRDVSVGVVFLTQENKDKPWILFETGALAKGLTSNRVCTFLIDLKPTDLQDPLAQFNHTLPEKSGLWELIRTINSSITENPLDDKTLEKVFNTYWPQFNNGFLQALEDNPIGEIIPPRSEQDILSEILNNTRTLNQKIRKIEDDLYLTPSKANQIVTSIEPLVVSPRAQKMTITPSDIEKSTFYVKTKNGNLMKKE
ncbi:toll/interleukin-1 receptor domain-containing protein [Klebsiella quasipneumoniae]|uniref:toll/interleukin-1 receptor domain-containing protein n=1 Tax=Klebsiella quasipneumoniae TaxID=1463165 RepID=UPI0021817D6D|nr:toll/interleukin-1 receptor domain-containing protein [Klebsiella quasipneumoniae]GKP26918.1 hypothetical protein NUKP16_47690 [Klebsiella quasipneumoniae]GKQ03911.1 hypothetical protein NUKP771_24900 [Klebsiella quasipneumoniae]